MLVIQELLLWVSRNLNYLGCLLFCFLIQWSIYIYIYIYIYVCVYVFLFSNSSEIDSKPLHVNLFFFFCFINIQQHYYYLQPIPLFSVFTRFGIYFSFLGYYNIYNNKHWGEKAYVVLSQTNKIVRFLLLHPLIAERNLRITPWLEDQTERAKRKSLLLLSLL